MYVYVCKWWLCMYFLVYCLDLLFQSYAFLNMAKSTIITISRKTCFLAVPLPNVLLHETDFNRIHISINMRQLLCPSLIPKQLSRMSLLPAETSFKVAQKKKRFVSIKKFNGSIKKPCTDFFVFLTQRTFGNVTFASWNWFQSSTKEENVLWLSTNSKEAQKEHRLCLSANWKQQSLQRRALHSNY